MGGTQERFGRGELKSGGGWGICAASGRQLLDQATPLTFLSSFISCGRSTLLHDLILIFVASPGHRDDFLAGELWFYQGGV